MLRTVYPVFLFFFLMAAPAVPQTVSAQGFIRGKVVSAENGKPIAGASIFISNTSKGTVTDEKGEFTLYNIPTGKYVLVISDVGFQTDLESIDSRDLKPFYAISMRVKTEELGEVTVRAFDKNGWKRWGEFFREYFVGTSAFSKRCKILNPEAVRIYYNKKRKILSAYSEGPILIQNRALGYLLQVNLEDFRVNFNNQQIDFSIFPLFKEMTGTPKQVKQWAQNREDAYYGSSMHFYRALFRDRVKDEGFSIRLLAHRDSTQISRIKSVLRGTVASYRDSTGALVSYRKPPESYLDKATLTEYDSVLSRAESDGNLVEYEGTIDPSSIIEARDSNAIVVNFDDVVKVTYLHKAPPDEYLNDYGLNSDNPDNQVRRPIVRATKEGMSTNLELTRGMPIEIFPNGSYMNTDLIFMGFWTWWQKMGTLLPFDYEPLKPMPPGPDAPGPGATGPTHESN
jgi:hypothetical protein